MDADFIEQWKRDAAAVIKEYARVHQHAYRELPTSFSGWVVHKDLVLVVRVS